MDETKKYACDCCGTYFDEKEYLLTSDKNKCILHCEKNSINEWYTLKNDIRSWNKKKVNYFWKKIQEKLDNLYETSFYESYVLTEEYIFDKIIFPKFQLDNPHNPFEFDQEHLATNFYSYDIFEIPNEQPIPTLNNVFIKVPIFFKECKFLESAAFSRYQFKKAIKFNKCIFERNVNFSLMTIEKKFKFVDCLVLGEANFEKTKFNSLVGFEKTKFEKVNFKNVKFNSIVRFVGTEFKDDINFIHTYFNKKVVFNEMLLNKKINLEKAIFFDSTIFYNIKYKDNCVQNRETARIIKDSFEQQNNIIEANKFYALEMEEREKELSLLKNPFEWLVFKFHKISSDHSQDWLLSLFWIINITFLFGLIDIEKISYVQILDKTLILLIAGIGISYISMKYHAWLFIPFTYIYYKLYLFGTNDSNLDCFAKNLNPFSIMRGDEPITFGTLIFKIIIAYLIYQLIISIRQNTRRK